MKLLKKVFNLFFIILLVLFVVSWFQVEKLPGKEEIIEVAYNEPIQNETEASDINVAEGDFQAVIDPLYEYEIWGLIVEDYSSDVWYDYIHKRYDPFNTKDICVIWGDDVRDNKYENIEFSHGEFTCYFQAKSREAYAAFNPYQLSNNHLVPANKQVAKKINQAKISDQIYLKGYLTNNSITLPDGRKSSRNSSTIRTDTGNGACEVIYVTEFKILKEGNFLWSRLYSIGKWGSIGTFIMIILLFIIETQLSFLKYKKLKKSS